ncbi:ATP-binding protein [Marinobacter sp.]|uniref:ATP-binding protein n=1 Tax=Marinobacter sp. TaxID=50741 RepID=UPI003561E9E2
MKTLSLSTRVVLITSLSIIISVGLILFIAYDQLLRDFEQVLAERQSLHTSMAASRVNQELAIRLNTLSAFASILTDGDNLLPLEQLNDTLKRQPALEKLFDGGLIVLDDQSRAIAENTFVPHRLGTSYADRAHFKRAIASQKATVSRPIIGRVTGLPLLSFLAPIKANDGTFLGFAAGTINLAKNGILPKGMVSGTGTIFKVLDTGHFIQVDALKDGIQAPELPNPGDDPLIDAALSGVYAGVITDNNGERWVYATQHLERLGWLFLSAAPYEQATLPAKASFQKFLWASVAAMLPLLLITYLLTRVVTRNLSSMSDKINRMASNNTFNQRLREQGSSETRNLAKAFNTLMEEREALDSLKSQFVSNVSHELRTPLTSINGSLKLLSSGTLGSLSEKAASMVDVALRNGEHLQVLITDLLDFDKAISGKLSIQTCTFHVEDAMRSACEDNQSMASQYGVQLTTEHAGDLKVCADPDRFRQILSNFLSNAIKYSPNGGLIRVKAEAITPEFIRITVADQGDGVPEPFVEQLFQRFAQAERGSSRAKAGTGLGLAICRELALLMGGDVGYLYQNGAQFWVELPTAEHRNGTDHENT